MVQSTVLDPISDFQAPEVVATRATLLRIPENFVEIPAAFTLTDGHSAVTLDFSAAGNFGSDELNEMIFKQLARIEVVTKALQNLSEEYVAHLATLALEAPVSEDSE